MKLLERITRSKNIADAIVNFCTVEKHKEFVPQLNIKTCGQNQKNKIFQRKQKPQKPLGY